ncbi:hypothetical protein L596_017675 [Steinernema carpocapsae]|uniref:histone acetyltransferase n=1 Tax=Steinernema carpocapsae TaxID=34508 RepID=A0A4U5N2D9_STECR|nr:hypothetical protein L596_017675 [Steinernema carpocapsae]
MEKINSLLEDGRDESIQRAISALVHACQCSDTNCRRISCSKMKRVVSHARSCQTRKNSNITCPVCKQLIALCCYHAKNCNLESCPVPFCTSIHHKLQDRSNNEYTPETSVSSSSTIFSQASQPQPDRSQGDHSNSQMHQSN